MKQINSSDGRVVRTYTFGAVDSGLTPIRVKPTTLKLVFTTFPLDAQHEKGQQREQAGQFTWCAVEKGT